MKDKEHKQLETHTVVLSLLILLLLAVVGLVANGVRSNAKYEVRKVNNAWIEELDHRGLIIKNDNGGFRWKQK